MKTIYDYFEEEVEYPMDLCDNMLPYGTVLCEVSTTLLDAFINHTKPLLCFVLDDYLGAEGTIEKGRAHVSNKETVFDYYYFEGTKRELIQGINTGAIVVNHTNLHMFGDDIVILSKIAEGKYMWFWYHMSGRCDVGRFKTKDSDEEVCKYAHTWLKEKVSDNSIKGYHKLKIENFLTGWVSF